MLENLQAKGTRKVTYTVYGQINIEFLRLEERLECLVLSHPTAERCKVDLDLELGLHILQPIADSSRGSLDSPSLDVLGM